MNLRLKGQAERGYSIIDGCLCLYQTARMTVLQIADAWHLHTTANGTPVVITIQRKPYQLDALIVHII